MEGLRTRESENFKRFFSIVQETAKKENKIFFFDTGEGRDFIFDDIEGEDLSGWLIPKEKVNEFEKEWKNDKNLDEWSDFITFAIWELDDKKIKITLKKF